jgi:hypothetical protein
MFLDLVEYITIEDVPENRNVPRKIHIYYKFLGKELANKQNALVHGISTSKKLVNKIQQDKTTNMWYNKRKSQRRYIP